MPTAPYTHRAPMLCKTSLRDHLEEHSVWENYVAEPKHDGARCLVVRDSSGVHLYSRTGGVFTDHVPHLVAELSFLPAGTVLDGELALIDRQAVVHGETVPVTDFNKTMRVLGSLPERGRGLQSEEFGNLSLIVYDVPELGGVDHTGDTWTQRRKTLSALRFPKKSRHILLNTVFTDPTRFGALFDDLVSHGVEGIITKNVEGRYAFDGRPNKTWYKVKAQITMDMVVSGYTEGAGKFAGLIGAIEFSRLDPETGELVYVGKCSGMTDAVRREVTECPQTYLGRVIEIKCNELVGSKTYRTPRHPQFVCFRIDKNPDDCTGEELRAAPVSVLV